MKKIVLFGGGTGLSQILKGLKLFPVEVSAIISVSDNGGSTGLLKEELDMPAIGDIAKVVISMADVNKDIMDMLSYRFDDRTSLENHPIKNLLLAALYDIKGNLTESTEILCKFLNIKGKILPLTEEKVELVGHLKDKKVVVGEENITKCYSVIEDLSYNKEFEENAPLQARWILYIILCITLSQNLHKNFYHSSISFPYFAFFSINDFAYSQIRSEPSCTLSSLFNT